MTRAESLDNVKLSPDKKLAGILCPVFSIRTENDLGIGDTEGVRQMIDWCHKHGIGLLQVLPINETSDDNSPYNAISSMALDPTTDRHLARAHSRFVRGEVQGDCEARSCSKELRAGPVKYTKVKELKRSLLRAAFDAFLAKHWNKKTRAQRSVPRVSRRERRLDFRLCDVPRVDGGSPQLADVGRVAAGQPKPASSRRSWLSSQPDETPRRVDARTAVLPVRPVDCLRPMVEGQGVRARRRRYT